jgi:diguanylate cyclase (GGDEF)-like protein/PAS domain S-box-containing protein
VEPLSNEILTEIVIQDSQGLLVVDASGPVVSIVFANPAYVALSGHSLAELNGADWLTHAAADEESPDIVRLRQALAADEPIDQSLPFLRKDGTIWLARLRLSRIARQDRERRLWLVQHPVDATTHGASAEMLKRVLGQARRKLAGLDRTDQVTGLMARGRFELLLRHELAVARRDDRSLCLLLFSVPELDVYRKTFGDNAADSCLRMIGAQITGTFRRASDLCARVDETTLAVVALGQDDAQAERLVALVEKKARNLGLHNPRGRMGRHVVVRGAWTRAEPDSDDIESLLARARSVLQAQSEGAPSKLEPA